MELRQLEYFVAVAEELHFTRAAARVHVVQSSLSSSIGALERELGARLFTRTNRRVALTEAGRALLPSARRALAAAESGRDAVAGVRGLVRGRLTIGAIQTLGVLDLPALLARYHRRHPGVTVRLRHAGAAALARETAAGTLDLAFVDGATGEPGLAEHPLGGDRLVLAVSRDDPLAARGAVRLADPVLAGRDFVEYRADSALRAQIDAACARAGLDRRVAAEVDTIQYLVELVGHGLGVSLLPPQALRNAADRVAAVPTDPPLHRALVAVTPATRPLSPAVEALLALLPRA
ncbi:LysR family transcriptional regulator [Actinomadura opuntiae]|uniref:LysR family transcriptional regulator n=1 Tax=Actinomadura sp. OS1-43 TaxID=604315 RepID=UPI00255A83DB|nr:LysR substrate-binding domain-containing protein [Actinomadura sp. OS1-43]MDL4814649.1 LysR substrate-binding domain-containing protein [Actinomadura sp. OS1-43]